MNRVLKHITLIISFVALLYGCRTAREVAPEATVMSTADMLLLDMHNSQASFEWMSTRFSGSVLFEGKTQSIAGSMRIKRDSAIYISIAPVLGIEVARALITPDSVKLVNRLDSSYYLGDLRVLARMFNADVDFYMLQALLTGNDFPHFRNDQFRVADDPRLIKLHAPARTRKSGQGNAIQQVISIDPSNMRIRTNIIEDNSSGRALRADYRQYSDISGRLLPVDLQLMFVDGTDNTNLEMLLSRTTLDVPQNMQFSVPPRYTPIPLTD